MAVVRNNKDINSKLTPHLQTLDLVAVCHGAITADPPQFKRILMTTLVMAESMVTQIACRKPIKHPQVLTISITP